MDKKKFRGKKNKGTLSPLSKTISPQTEATLQYHRLFIYLALLHAQICQQKYDSFILSVHKCSVYI